MAKVMSALRLSFYPLEIQFRGQPNGGLPISKVPPPRDRLRNAAEALHGHRRRFLKRNLHTDAGGSAQSAARCSSIVAATGLGPDCTRNACSRSRESIRPRQNPLSSISTR